MGKERKKYNQTISLLSLSHETSKQASKQASRQASKQQPRISCETGAEGYRSRLALPAVTMSNDEGDGGQ